MAGSGNSGANETLIALPLRLMTLLVIAAFVALGAQSAAAQQFEVPDGFEVARESTAPGDEDWRPLLTVRPVEGPFSELSAIHLRQVTGAVDDQDTWLKRRLTADIGDPKDAGRILDSPDSPFGDPIFDTLRKALPELFKTLQQAAELPLKFCDNPRTAYNASGSFRELYCVFNIGPTRQYRILRLQRAQGRWFYTEIRTMNERRLRHLIAIANSFYVGI